MKMVVNKKKYVVILGLLFLVIFIILVILKENKSVEMNKEIPNLQIEMGYKMITRDWTHEIEPYTFFTNPNQWGYNLTNEMAVAGVVSNYVMREELREEEWELRKMYARYDENMQAVFTAFVRAESDRELYLFINDMEGSEYFIIADITKGNSLQTSLGDGAYSYNSSIPWYSYRESLQNNKNNTDYLILIDEDAMIFDSSYIEEGTFAMTDFLNSKNAEKNTRWELLKDKVYIGVNGFLTSLWYSNGKQRVNIIIDVWNKLYAVVEVVNEI